MINEIKSTLILKVNKSDIVLFELRNQVSMTVVFPGWIFTIRRFIAVFQSLTEMESTRLGKKIMGQIR